MADNFIRSRPTVTWAASTAYVLGDRRRSTGTVPALGIHFEVTTAGTSGAAEPAWNTTVGGTTTDNTVTWTTRGSANTWVASTAYVVGDRAVSTTAATTARQGRVFECTTAGTSAATEPAWNATVGGTTTEGTVTWTTRAPTTWNNAHITLRGLFAGTSSTAVGDRVFVGDEHAETHAVSISLLAPAGVRPMEIWGVVDTGDPAVPTTSTPTTVASFTTTATSSITFTGGFAIHRIKFNCGTGTGSPLITINGSNTLEDCELNIIATGSSSTINMGTTDELVMRNTSVSFGATNQGFSISSYGLLVWEDTETAVTGATIPDVLFELTTYPKIRLRGLGMAAIATGKNLFGFSAGEGFEISCHGVSLGSGGTVVSGIIDDDSHRVLSASHIGSGTDIVNFDWVSMHGSIIDEQTVVRSGGATNGTTPFSWRVVTTANDNILRPFESAPIILWQEATGSPITATIEILRDSLTNLTDKDVWVEVLGQSVSSSLRAVLHSDRRSDPLTAAVDQAASSVTWTTTGLTNPNKQKLDVTFTPQVKGPLIARVKVALPSATIFIDPKITVT